MVAVAALAQGDTRQEEIRFAEGTFSTTLTGKITGYEDVDYQVRGREGQSMAVTLRPSNLSAYFNVLPPASEAAIYIGSIYGNHFEGKLPVDGVYTIRVYLMRNAARRDETAAYTLEVGLTGEGPAAGAPSVTPPAHGTSYDRAFELQGIRFHVTAAQDGPVTTLQIVPAGLEIDNSPIVRTVDGTVTGAEVADLNGDGSPEIYVYVSSAGGGAHGSLVAYSANRRKSLSEIYLHPITEDEAASKGYRGHDEFAVLEGVLGQRFPVYREADTDANPTGGMRQLQYKLVPGEAGWLLEVDRVVDY